MYTLYEILDRDTNEPLNFHLDYHEAGKDWRGWQETKDCLKLDPVLRIIQVPEFWVCDGEIYDDLAMLKEEHPDDDLPVTHYTSVKRALRHIGSKAAPALAQDVSLASPQEPPWNQVFDPEDEPPWNEAMDPEERFAWNETMIPVERLAWNEAMDPGDRSAWNQGWVPEDKPFRKQDLPVSLYDPGDLPQLSGAFDSESPRKPFLHECLHVIKLTVRATPEDAS